MNFLKFLKKLLRIVDFFGTTEFFRYKSEQTFQTLFGGFFSTLMILGISVLLFYRIFECFNRVNITFTKFQKIQSNPSLFNLQTEKGKFMVAAEIPGIDWADPEVRYFDFVLIRYSLLFNQTTDKNEYYFDQGKLEPCTEAHWQGFPNVANDLKLLNMSRLQCLPINSTFSVQGKYASFEQRDFSLFVGKANCDQNWTDSRRCATHDEYNKFFSNPSDSRLQIYFINYEINPERSQHINYFLDDRYAAYFSEKRGSSVILYFQNYTITTDQSIYFHEDLVEQTGATVEEEPLIADFFLSASKTVAEVRFAKSYWSKSYERKFYKIQDVFSVVGGLFSILLGCLSFLNSYNNSAFSIAIGTQLFALKEDKQKDFQKRFTFLSFLAQISNNFMKKMGFPKFCSSAIEYSKCQKQVMKQLDVLYLIKRVIFLQSAISVILKGHHVTGLHLRKKMTLEEAKQKRQGLKLKQKVQRMNLIQMTQKSSFLKNENPFQRIFIRNEIPSFSLKQRNQSMKEESDLFFSGETNEKEIRESKVQKFNGVDRIHEEFSQEQNSEFGQPLKNFERNQIIQDIIKIKQEAKKGSQISKNILQFSNTLISQAFTSFIPSLIQPRKPQKVQLRPINLQQNQTVNPIDLPNSQIKRSNLKIFKVLKQFILSMDFFRATQFFRYSQNQSHKSVFGGIISLLIFIGLISLFYMRILSVINKQKIISTEEKTVSPDPPLVKLTTGPEGDFMSFIMIGGFPLSHPTTRSFDIYLEKGVSKFNEEKNMWTYEVSKHPLETCSYDRFQDFIYFEKWVEKMDIEWFACFPKNFSFQLQGKSTSNEFRTLDLVVASCTDQFQPSRPCETTGYADYYFTNFYSVLVFFMTNTIVDPKSVEYISRYLHDLTQFFINPAKTNMVQIELEDFTVTTDLSIFPWTDQIVQTGSITTKNPVIHTYEKSLDEYARISITKSTTSRRYYRSFQKLIDVFAFIGGILEIILAALLFIGIYNKFEYEVILGSKLFRSGNEDKNFFKNYNFLSFIKQGIFNFLYFFRLKLQWSSILEYVKCQKEMQKQLDIMYIFKRLEFLETAISTILDDQQKNQFHLNEKISLEESRKRRKGFKLKREFLKVKNTIGIEKIKIEEKDEKKEVNFLQSCPNEQSPAFFIHEHEKSNETSKGILQKKSFKKIMFGQSGQNDEISDASEDESDPSEGMDRNEIFEDLARLKEEAMNGERIGEKVLGILSKVVSSVLASDIISERKSLSKGHSRSRGEGYNLDVLEINEEESEHKRKFERREILWGERLDGLWSEKSVKMDYNGKFEHNRSNSG